METVPKARLKQALSKGIEKGTILRPKKSEDFGE